MKSSRWRAWIVLVGSIAVAWSLVFSGSLKVPTGTATLRGMVSGPTATLIPGTHVSLQQPLARADRDTRKPRQGLSSLPVAAQAVVSATLGRDDARYQVRPKAGAPARQAEVPRASCPCSGMAKMAMAQSVGALSAQNPAQQLEADFTRQGMDVRSGQAHWRLELSGYGYGDRLDKVEGAAPQNRANRVEYQRGPLVEWYVNGPAGLEQGFTLSAPPALGTRDTGHGTRKTGHGIRDTGHGISSSSPLTIARETGLGTQAGVPVSLEGAQAGVPVPPEDSSPLTIALELGGDLTATVDLPANGQEGARAEGLTLRDSHGQAVLRYTGLAAHDASGRALVAWLEVDKEELRLRVEDAGARYPVAVDPFVQQAKLTVSDGAEYDELGISVGVSGDGNTIVAGAPNNNSGQGAAYVFVKPGGGWANMTQVAKLTSSDGGGNLGRSVAVSSDASTIVSGAPQLTSTGQGAVYVFVEPAGGWGNLTQTAKLTASDGLGGDGLGYSVGVSGDGSTIVAGAPAAAVDSNGGEGAAYVFVKPGGGWENGTQTAKLIASDGASYDELGYSVGVSSDASTIVAGALKANIGSHPGQGAAYVFVKPGGGWAGDLNQTAKLTAWDGAMLDSLGFSVGVSSDGSTIVAGAPFAAVGFTREQGAAYVSVKPGRGWATISTFTAKLTASDGAGGDSLGYSVGISSDASTIVAGALNANIGSHLGQGAAYVFVKPGGGWAGGLNQTAKLTASDGASGDYLGYSVGVSSDGSTIVAGAPFATIGANYEQGAAYVFLATPSASLSATSLSFGSQAAGTTSIPQTVSLTSDGNAPLHVTSVAASSGFSTTSECVTASPLAVGAYCTEAVTFDPASAVALSGTLTFTDDSGGVAGSTQTVSLSGTGVLATTTTSIILVDPSPSVVGEAVGVAFVVDPPADDSLTPSGTVTVNASTGESCTGSAPAGSCSLTFLTAGTRNITATYNGDSKFTGGASAPASETVNALPIPPTVTFTGAPASLAYQGTFTVASTTNSSSSPVYTSSGPCSNSGPKYTMTSGTGTCYAIATWAADVNYASAKAIQRTTASKIAPTVTFTGAPESEAYQGTFTVASTTDSSSSPVYSASGSCTNVGTLYTMTKGTGACTSKVSWVTDANYLRATMTQTTTAGKIGQTISFTTAAPSTASYQSTFPVAASSDSGLTVALSVASGSVCSLGPRTTGGGVTSATVTMKGGTGTCYIDANQAGNNNYTAATQQQTWAAALKIGQTITITTPAPSSASVNSAFPVAADSSSGLTVALSVDAGSTGVCKLGPRTIVSGVTNATVTMLKSTGTCTLDANQAGNGNYSAAAQVSTSAGATP